MLAAQPAAYEFEREPRAAGPGKPELAQRPAPQVYYLDGRALTAVLSKLTGWQIRHVMRYRYVPVGQTGCIVTDQRSYAAAISHNRTIAGWTRPRDLLQALHDLRSQSLVDEASRRLARDMPKFSAARLLSVPQAVVGALAGGLLVLAGVLAPVATLIAVSIACSLLFLSVAAVRAASLLHVPLEEEAHDRIGLSDEALPDYTVVVPLFKEIEVVDQLVAALRAMNYPAGKLDIKLVLEQEDITMRRWVAQLQLPAHFEVLVVPSCSPQTKPKALNYALAFARGDLLAIYDAEDVPEPNQLRDAAEVFANAPASLACLQARLAYYNANENWLTRQFAIEYAALFDLLLPMLAHAGLPFPLGGTSNHFRISVLRKIGAWDPHNVTEDADLGLRLARLGWRVGVLRSTTYEEANCKLDNWLSQRARWLKGWMQTWLVHMRSPWLFWRELGPRGFLASQIMMLGMIVTALLHPVFLGFVIWVAVTGLPGGQAPTVGSALLIGFGLVVLVAGYGFAIAAGAKGLVNRGLADLSLSLASMPVYWLLISAGGWLALWQLVSQPHYWNKTAHGLSRFISKPVDGPGTPGRL